MWERSGTVEAMLPAPFQSVAVGRHLYVTDVAGTVWNTTEAAPGGYEHVADLDHTALKLLSTPGDLTGDERGYALKSERLHLWGANKEQRLWPSREIAGRTRALTDLPHEPLFPMGIEQVDLNSRTGAVLSGGVIHTTGWFNEPWPALDVDNVSAFALGSERCIAAITDGRVVAGLTDRYATAPVVLPLEASAVAIVALSGGDALVIADPDERIRVVPNIEELLDRGGRAAVDAAARASVLAGPVGVRSITPTPGGMLVLDGNGDVWACGTALSGEHGVGLLSTSRHFVRIDVPPAVAIGASRYEWRSAVVTADGDLYVAGSNFRRYVHASEAPEARLVNQFGFVGAFGFHGDCADHFVRLPRSGWEEFRRLCSSGVPAHLAADVVEHL